MGNVSQAAHHPPLAQHPDDVDARVVRQNSQRPELHPQNVAEVAQDGHAVADHDDPPARLGGHGVIDGAAHSGLYLVGRLGGMHVPIVQLGVDLDEPVVHPYVLGDGPRGLECSPERAGVDGVMGHPAESVREPPRLLTAPR